MVSIREAVNHLDQMHQARAKTLDCYLAALRDMARYAVELDASITPLHRKSLEELAEQVSSGDDDTLEGSKGLLRALLREYRDRSSAYLASLKDELSDTARALEETLESLGKVDGDDDARLRAAILSLREISGSPVAAAVRGPILDAADGIDRSLEQIRKNHQLTVAQFQVEIRMLHQRIDSLETAAAIDGVTELLKRPEMEHQIRESRGEFCLILIRVGGFYAAERAYRKEIGVELAGAFTKRLWNGVPSAAVISRWSHEEFVALLPSPKPAVLPIAKWIGEHLSGDYSILLDGKLVHPRLQVSVAVVEGVEDEPDAVFSRIEEFLKGR